MTTATALPPHLVALHRANEVRHARAELKRDVSLGRVDIGHLILACPWEVRTMMVADLLTAQPRWGSVRTRKLLTRLRISELKRVETLTDRQCHAISDLLRSTRSQEGNGRLTGALD